MTMISSTNFISGNYDSGNDRSKIQEQGDEQSSSVFSVYDKNKDGTVSIQEQKQWLFSRLNSMFSSFKDLMSKFNISLENEVNSVGIQEISTDGTRESAEAANHSVNQHLESLKASLLPKIKLCVDAQSEQHAFELVNNVNAFARKFMFDSVENKADALEEAQSHSKLLQSYIKVYNGDAEMVEILQHSLKTLYHAFPDIAPKKEEK